MAESESVATDFSIHMMTAPSEQSSHWSDGAMPWSGIRERIENPKGRTSKPGSRMWHAARPKPDTPRNDDGTVRKQKATMGALTAVVIEIDGTAPADIAERVRDLPYVAAAYTTFGHTPDSPHWRIIVPPTEEYDPADREVMNEAVAADLALPEYDKAMDSPAQGSYQPIKKIPGGVYTYAFSTASARASTADLLARGRELVPEKPAGDAQPSRESPTVGPDDLLDPFEARERLDGCYRAVARTLPGENRNNTLLAQSRAAGKLYARIPEAQQTGPWDRRAIEAELLKSIQDDTDPKKSKRTITSGVSFGIAHWWEMNDEDGSVTAGTESGDLDSMADKRYLQLKADREARRRLAAEDHADDRPFEIVWSGHRAAPRGPDRIAGLVPMNSHVALVAQPKAGKTVLSLNMADALITGEPFLGEFEVKPIAPDASVVILSYEMSQEMMDNWVEDLGIPENRLAVVPLAGRGRPLADPVHRANIAQALRDARAEFIIVDTFSAAFTGSSENDTTEVKAWLIDLDKFVMDEVGADGVLLVMHSGRGDKSRAAGAISLDGHPANILLLSVDEKTGMRQLRATQGRMDEKPTRALSFDPTSRRVCVEGERTIAQITRDLTDAQIMKEDLSARQTREDVLRFIYTNPRVLTERITAKDNGVSGGRDAKRAALKELIDAGSVVTERATGTPGMFHTLAPGAEAGIPNEAQP